MAANEEYQAEILETALPVLNHWIEDRKRRDGALLWYGSLGRAKPQVVGDLAAVVKTTDDDFAVKIALTMKRTGGPAGILVAGRLLADPATRKHALEILRGAEAKAGPIAKDVIRELIVCDQAEVQSDQSERYKRSLRHILTKTDTIPSEAIPVLIELDAISPVYRGDIISWLQKNSSPLSTSIARQMREWNRQAVVAEIQGDYYSRENVHTKKRTKRAAISPDAKQLAVLEEKQLRLLDISSGEQFRAVDLPYGVGEWHRLGFDPSGRYLVATYLRSSFVWEFATGKLLTHDAPSDLNVLSDPNILQGGNVQVVFGKRKYRGPAVIDLELRDLSTGKRIGQATYPVNNPRSRNRAPGWLHLQLSPGGSVLALLYTGGIVEIRQTPDLEVVAELNLVDEFPQTQFDRPQFTADGKTLVFAGDDGYLRFWDYPDPENIRTTYTGRSGPYWLLGQGQWVLHRDCHGQSTAMLADTSGNRTPVSLYFGASDPDITVTANGKFFEVATHNGIRLFETAKLEKYFTQKRSDK
jgi:WD40 repeat protein